METITIFFFRLRAYHFLLLFLGCFLLSSFLSISIVKAQLNGTYTIGGMDRDYANFTRAVNALKAEGVSGPVTFKVRSGTYHERLNIFGIPGNSCENTITFEGDSLDRSKVILQAPGIGTQAVRVRWTAGIQFRNMTIKGTSNLVEVGENSNCFSLENNILLGESGTLVKAYTGTYERPSHHHHYQGNLFLGGETGLSKGRGSPYTTTPGFEEGLLVIGNEFRGQSGTGVSLYMQTDYSINYNKMRTGFDGISSLSSPNGKEVIGNIIEVAEGEFAIGFFFGAPEKLTDNQITINVVEYGGTGLHIESSFFKPDEVMLIANNLIIVSYNHYFNYSGWSGLTLNTANAKIYHNSVLLLPSFNKNGSVVDWSYGSFYALNNNFSNLSGEYLISPNAVEMDYNNLYAQNFDLAEWQSRTGKDAHSISVRPDNQTLHPVLKGAGIYLPEVPEDLSGQMRPDPPTIGAIEMDIRKHYIIGGEDGDFGSFTEAMHFLERSFGLDSLVFSVRPGTYHEQLIINAQNLPHVTFQGESGDSTEVVLKFPGDYVLRILGGSHYTFRHMTISGNGAVRIEAKNNIEADHFTFENNILKSSGDAAVVSTFALAENMGTTNSSVDFLSLRNNYIEGMGWGIQKEGSIIHHIRHGVYTLSDAVLDISGNHIKTGKGGMFISNTRIINLRNNKLLVESSSSSIEPEGIHLKGCYQLKKINENHLEINGAAAKGIWINGTVMGGYFGQNLPDEFNGNKILLPEGGTGILLDAVYSKYPSQIVNNMVSVNGKNGSIGIHMKGDYINPNFSFNSILIYGDDVESKVISLSNTDTGPFANNVFANLAGGVAFYARNSLSNNPSILPSSDYNDFYTAGVMLAHWYGEDVADLNEWQSLTAHDVHSISADPQFKSVEFLIPTNEALDGAGVSMEEVKTDFFGQFRKDPPDMGAVEFESSPEVPGATPGFVVGGGVIHSPVGAITDDFQWEGRAIFSFHAIQKKKDKSPRGIASLTIPEKDFRFQSVHAYEWMSVNGNTAILQGTGSFNRAAGYRFVISVDDKGTGPGQPKDTYRIIIWSPEEEVIYDNQRGLPVYAIASRPIDRGNVMVRPELSRNARLKESSTVQEEFEEFKAYPTSLEGGELWIEIPAHAVTGEGTEGQLSILDQQGRLLAEKKVYQAGKLNWRLQSQNWSPGVYILIFRTDQQLKTQKLVK